MANNANWTNAFDITTDAGFRAVGSSIHTALTGMSANLTQASDTGQINWSTVTHPTVANTAQGYEIWTYNDGISTLKIKIEFGSSLVTGNGSFSMWFTVGTGTDGAGTITGVLMPRTQSQSGAVLSKTNSYPSYACAATGTFWILVGVGSTNDIGSGGTCQTFFGFARSCDSSGNPSSAGIEFWVGGSNVPATPFVCYDLSRSQSYSTTQGGQCLVPYGITATNYGTGGNSTYQVFRHDLPLLPTQTTAHVGSYVASEAGAATTTTMALVGSTTHTFFFTGAAANRSANGGSGPNSSYAYALVYE